MPWLTVAVVVYGVLIVLGGVMGYATARSTDSLLVGGVIGLLVLGSAALSKSTPKLGFGAAALLAVAVVGIFIKRYMDTGKPMPAFGIIGLSVLMLFLLVMGHLSGATNTTSSTPPTG